MGLGDRRVEAMMSEEKEGTELVEVSREKRRAKRKNKTKNKKQKNKNKKEEGRGEDRKR